jgi:hypothetical protein
MSGKQHVDFYRKVLMRRHLMRHWPPDNTAAYVPFIGDGDLAVELYRHLLVYGADLDPDRVATAAERLPAAQLLAGDCNDFPFATWKRLPHFGLADFDAYAEPYAAFRSWWNRAPKADRVLLFFTDVQRQSMLRVGSWISPDGMKLEAETEEGRPIFNAYLTKYVWPWFEDFVAPWRVVDRFRYLRGWMVYWGAVIELA